MSALFCLLEFFYSYDFHPDVPGGIPPRGNRSTFFELNSLIKKLNIVVPCTSVLLAVLSFGSLALAQDWTWQNPKPAGNTLFAVKAIDANTVVMAGVSGTVVKSSDGGVTYTLLSSAGGFKGVLRALWFSNASVGWCVGDSSTILRTTDGGDSWTRVSPSRANRTLFAVYFPDGVNGWVVGDSGVVYHSTDAGATWARQSVPFSLSLRSVFAFDGSNVYIGGADGLLFTSSSGGHSWSVDTLGLNTLINSVAFMDADTGWVGTDAGVLVTTDGGADWALPVTPAPFQVNALYRPSVNSSGIYAGGTNAFAASSNFGRDFSTRKIDSLSVYYDMSFADSLHGWVCGLGGDVRKTTNAGATWISNSGTTVSDISDIAVLDSTHFVIAGTDGSLYHSADGGLTYAAELPELTTRPLFAFSFASPTSGWVVGGNGSIFHTTNAGVTWTAQNSGTQRTLRACNFVNTQIGYAAGDSVFLYTTNGGTNWTSQYQSDTGASFRQLHFSAPDSGAALVYEIKNVGARILTTTDGGRTWKGQQNIITGATNQMSFYSSSGAYAVGNGNTIIGTTDGGNSWVAGVLPVSNIFTAVLFLDENDGWIGGANGSLMKTNDGGATWYALNTTASNEISKIDFIDPQLGWIVGQRGMILKSTDGGGVGTLIPIKRPALPIIAGSQQFTNFPNPVMTYTYIPYNLRVGSHIDVEMYDLLGRPIRHVFSGNSSPGVHDDVSSSIYWDARDDAGQKVASGVYFYTIQTSYGTLYGKLIVIH